MTTKNKKLSTYEIISLIISVIGLGSLVFLVIQTKQLSDSLESAALTNVSSREFEINKIFVEHPNLQPYFFSGVDIDEKNPDYPKVIAIARLRLDFISTFYDQSGFVSEYQDKNSPGWQAWKRYIKEIFSSSPVMCKQLEDAKQDYTSEFVDFVKEGCSQK